LIQALGTRGSDMLIPRVQRFFIDEDCLLLLCSDGLSDFERVVQIYDDYLRPVVNENKPLDRSCQDLIDKANELNGHDNITVALMRCRFAPADEQEDLVTENNIPASIYTDEKDLDTEDIQPESGDLAGALALTSPDSIDSEDTEFEIRDREKDIDVNSAKTEFAVPKQTNSTFIIILILVALILGSGLAAMQFPQVKNWVRQNLPTNLQRFVP
jgi:protein phosphatase